MSRPDVAAEAQTVPPLSNHIIRSLTALRDGVASEQQQVDAFNWIVNVACRTHMDTWAPDNQRVSDFLAGRRSAGLQILRAINMPITKDDKDG